MRPRQLPNLAKLLPTRGLASLTEDIQFISLWRWARLTLVIGAVVGLAAAGVFYVLEWGEAVLLHRLGGLEEPGFGTGQRLFDHGASTSRWWILLTLPAVGGLVAGLLIWRFAREARGAGVNPVIDEYHNGDARIPPRVPIVKLIATLFTLGSGGSAGREGPMAQIGAGVGSFLGARMQLTARERRLLLLAGAAGGISALFRAPLGAALWSLEVLYRNDFESEGLFPCLVSSVTAYSVFTLVYGDTGSLFSVPGSYDFQPTQLVFYAALAVACAPMAVLWVKMLDVSERRIWSPMRLPAWAKPALGGLLLGAMSLALPWVFSTGYGWMQDALRTIDDPARLLPVGYKGFGLLLGIALAKMLATSFTVCSGGSGGIFAPTLFIGGFIGGAFGLLFHQLAPNIVTQPGAFVLVGMGAFYAGLGRVPIATIILISELFGSYDLLVPLMFTEMITLLLLGRFTLYQKQVENALSSPAHASDFAVDVLAEMHVRDYYTPGRASQTIPEDMTIQAFLDHVSEAADSFFVVRDKGSPALVGTVSLSNIRSIVSEHEFLDAMLVADAMWPLESVSPDENLRAALNRFLSSGYDRIPVIDPADRETVLGLLTQQQIFAAYDSELERRQDESEHERPDSASSSSSS